MMRVQPDWSTEATFSRPDIRDRDNVRLHGIRKHYAGIPAVQPLDLAVRSGEFLAILGPSGSGKTTTMRIIAGFVRPDAGRVEIAGRDVTDLPPHRRDVNTVFQSYGLIPHMTVKQNVEYGLKVKRVPRGERVRRVAEMLDLVRLSEAAERRPNELSGGMQQRVALARALVNRPSVLLLDEPLAALDRKLREDMQVELRRLQSELGLTFVYVTHDQEEALGMSDRLAVMNEGWLIQVGVPAEIYDDPSTLWIAGFVGASNRLDGTVVSAGGEVTLDTPATRLIAARVHGALSRGMPAAAVVRPEHIKIGPRGSGEPGLNRVPAKIVEVLNVGSHVKCVARAASGLELQVRRQRTGVTDDDVRVGDDVELSWLYQTTHVYPLVGAAPESSARETTIERRG
jgi:spermidine/putrescine transport system ATP-binding protein